MSVLEFVAVLVAGMAAGGINAMVGSGTLITFPTLLFLGYPPIVANVSNNIGLLAGGIGSIRGYRAELAGHTATIKRLIPASILGAATGAALLFILPDEAFSAIVPVLIALALVLVITGPRLQAWAAENHPDETGEGRMRLTLAGVFVAGVYGGYFGAAQGVLLIGVMSVLIAEPLQRLNGFKNVLGTTVNGVAALVFLVIAWDQIDWLIVLAIAIGALFGGYAGASVGRKLPPAALRGVIVVVGTIAIIKLVFFP